MTLPSDDIAAIFGEGSDARLNGLPLKVNPYQRIDNQAYRAWREGWLSVDSEWAKQAKWPHAALPAVRDLV